MQPDARHSAAILTYHSLDDSGAVTSLAPALFADQMRELADFGAPLVRPAQTLRLHRSVAVTFDDGYLNFASHALPVLARHNIPATLFVVTGWPGAAARYMDWAAIRDAAAAGIEIGAHSATHADLATLPFDQACDELSACRREIEDRVGLAVRSAAYPFGRSTPRLRQWARTQFDVVCGTRLGFVKSAPDPAHLPRLDVYYLRRLALFRSMMHGPGRAYLSARALLRALRSGWSQP